MIVAGSVLAMLLMGLAVDGFVNPVDEEDDTAPDPESGGDLGDQSGTASSALSDLLLAAEGDGAFDEDDDFGTSSSLGSAFDYTPIDDIELVDENAAEVLISGAPDEFDFDDSAESAADSEWASAAETPPGDAFFEVEDVIGLEDGNEVSFVTNFNAETDSLVLEFDGTHDDAPEIEIDHTSEDDAAVVLANGIPITLVEGTPDLTADHVRVVMSGEAIEQGPMVLPGAAEFDAQLEEPQVQPGLLDTEEPLLDGPQVLPGVDDMDSALFDEPQTLPGLEFGGPQTLPGVGTIVPTLEDVPDLPLDDTDLNLVDPLLDEGLETVLDPVETIVDEISDGLPLADDLTALLEGITSDLTDMGSTGDMLDARADIDAAFGTGGEDAFTGTFNNDLVTAGSGQDALFGDEGNDTLDAGAGNDELHGGTGNDLLMGGAGIDFLDGGEDDDMLDGGSGRDLLFGGDGDDVLYGGAAADFLQGDMGADIMNGGSGNDVLNGTFTDGAGGPDLDQGDLLWGGDGDDTLIVGRDDIAHGGLGADTFTSGAYIEDADIAGHVEDFDPVEDRIEVIFDPDVNPNPRVEVQDFADGSGADILLNGSVILSVSGAQGMDPNLIDLRAVA